MSRIPRLVLLLAAAATLLATPALAEGEDFYKGKTIKIVVGFTPGGGYDTYARLLSRFLSRYVPGSPAVVVQNMPGGGSLQAARSVDATQPKDGTVIVSFNANLITQAIVQPEAVKLDLGKLSWIGAPTPDFRVCYGYGDGGVRTWEEMMRRPQFVVGSEGAGSGDYVNAKTLRDVFNAPVKLVLGFPGSADARLAILRGELDGGCGALSSIPADWVSSGKAHFFVRFTKERPAEIPESARAVNDFATTQDQKDLLDFLDAVGEVGRPFAVSSDVPAERLALLRKAFDAAMADPELLAEARKAQLPIYPITGQSVSQIVARMAAAQPDLLARARRIYE